MNWSIVNWFMGDKMLSAELSMSHAQVIENDCVKISSQMVSRSIIYCTRRWMNPKSGSSQFSRHPTWNPQNLTGEKVCLSGLV